MNLALKQKGICMSKLRANDFLSRHTVIYIGQILSIYALSATGRRDDKLPPTDMFRP